MNYQEQCIFDLILFSWIVLKNCWLYITIALGFTYWAAKKLEKHFDI